MNQSLKKSIKNITIVHQIQWMFVVNKECYSRHFTIIELNGFIKNPSRSLHDMTWSTDIVFSGLDKQKEISVFGKTKMRLQDDFRILAMHFSMMDDIIVPILELFHDMNRSWNDIPSPYSSFKATQDAESFRYNLCMSKKSCYMTEYHCT